MNSRKAILFFVRNEHQEQQIKPLPRICGLVGSYRAINRTISNRLAPLQQEVDFVLATTGSQTAIPAHYRIQQQGESFGERIAQAVEDVFQLGYEQIVVIGNDCLDITTGDITNAFDKLDAEAEISAAPTHDGGAFLIGLQKDGFKKDLFARLPWQTPQLFDELVSSLSAETLPIIRTDYDSWKSSVARAVLTQFLSIALFPVKIERRLITVLTPIQHKALTRLFLPAPPLPA